MMPSSSFNEKYGLPPLDSLLEKAECTPKTFSATPHIVSLPPRKDGSSESILVTLSVSATYRIVGLMPTVLPYEILLCGKVERLGGEIAHEDLVKLNEHFANYVCRTTSIIESENPGRPLFFCYSKDKSDGFWTGERSWNPYLVAELISKHLVTFPRKRFFNLQELQNYQILSLFSDSRGYEK